MKILFISRAKNKNKISPIVLNQGNSLKINSCEVDFFVFKGSGLFGYLFGILQLRKKIKSTPYQIYHAHYLLSGIAATFAKAKPLIVSLMGSDVLSNIFFRKLSGFFSKHYWDLTIVKSLEMKNQLNNNHIEIIPNGVDLELFKPLSKNECQLKLNWSKNQKHILFAGDPSQKIKGYEVAKQSINCVKTQDLQLHILKNINIDNLPIYYNASDVVLLTSHKEGSPNVIKEAMACNCPIVSTDVGDVKEIISETQGCFVTTHNPKEIAEAIGKAIEFNKKTNGREAIQNLNSNVIANKLISLYNSL